MTSAAAEEKVSLGAFGKVGVIIGLNCATVKKFKILALALFDAVLGTIAVSFGFLVADEVCKPAVDFRFCWCEWKRRGQNDLAERFLQV